MAVDGAFIPFGCDGTRLEPPLSEELIGRLGTFGKEGPAPIIWNTSIETDHPAGGAMPSGGGLNLVTDFEHDDGGRITQLLGPVCTIDLDGAATAIRRAQWMVYKEASAICEKRSRPCGPC